VFVARRPGGLRRVEAIGEVVAGGDARTGSIRPLFSWHDGTLRRDAVPTRSARGPSAPPLDPRWFA